MPINAAFPVEFHAMITDMSEELQSRLELVLAQHPDQWDKQEVENVFHMLLEGLNGGAIRAASRREDGSWKAHAWVKQGILLGFRLGRLMEYPGTLPFFDKHTYPLKPININDQVRIVPGGSSIRTGSYLAPGVVCMPPMYVNVGAYVDEGSMIDSHALVGSCAQIGKHVHLSAAAQIGGVLEPVGALPVIIEDDVFVGGGCGIYEGCVVRRGAVLAPGVILTGATKLYDAVHEQVIERKDTGSLEVPEGAVIVPGSRPLRTAFGTEHGLSLYAPIIVKYRDEKTDASTVLETALR